MLNKIFPSLSHTRSATWSLRVIHKEELNQTESLAPSGPAQACKADKRIVLCRYLCAFKIHMSSDLWMMVRITNNDDSFSLDTFLLDKLNKGGRAKRWVIDNMIMFLEYKHFMLCKQQEHFWLAVICYFLFLYFCAMWTDKYVLSNLVRAESGEYDNQKVSKPFLS